MNRRKLFGLIFGGTLCGTLLDSFPAVARTDNDLIIELIKQEFEPMCRKYLFEQYDDIKDDLHNDCMNILTKLRNAKLIYEYDMSMSNKDTMVFIDMAIRIKKTDLQWYYMPVRILSEHQLS